MKWTYLPQFFRASGQDKTQLHTLSLGSPQGASQRGKPSRRKIITIRERPILISYHSLRSGTMSPKFHEIQKDDCFQDIHLLILRFHPFINFVQDYSQISFDVACQWRFVNLAMFIVEMMWSSGKIFVMRSIIPAQERNSCK